MMDIKKLCKSDTPKYYKKEKKDRRKNPAIENAIKCSLFEERFFDKYIIYKKSNCPESNSSYNTIKNQEYIKKLELKASEHNKSILSFEDYKKVIIKRKGILDSNPLLSKILKGGGPVEVFSKFDLKPNKILKSSSKKKNLLDIQLDVDYLRIQKNKSDSNDNAFCIQTVFGKNINLQNIIYNIESDGIDMLIAATKDILEIEYPKTNWKFWVLVIDLEENTSMLVEINQNNIDVARDTYKKRIKTLKECLDLKTYFHYDSLYSSDGSGIIKLPISKRTIDLRQKNTHW